MTSRKKPGAAFWATVVVVVAALIGYPLLLGPACWLAGDNETALGTVTVVYYPILWVGRISRSAENQGIVNDWIEWYATRGRKDGAWPVLLMDGTRAWAVPPDPDPGP